MNPFRGFHFRDWVLIGFILGTMYLLAGCHSARVPNPAVRVVKARPNNLRYWRGKPPVASRTRHWGVSNRTNK